MGYQDVVAVQVYLTDMDLFPRMNAVYTTYFKEPRPARTTVGVSRVWPVEHIHPDYRNGQVRHSGQDRLATMGSGVK